MLYEHRSKRPLSRPAFLRRMLRHLAAAGCVLVLSLAVGMLGFEHYQAMDWPSAFMNASLFLGGLGPLEDPETTAGRVFVGIFSLYSGLVFVLAVAIIAAPLLHRLLHIFHWDEKD